LPLMGIDDELLDALPEWLKICLRTYLPIEVRALYASWDAEQETSLNFPRAANVLAVGNGLLLGGKATFELSRPDNTIEPVPVGPAALEYTALPASSIASVSASAAFFVHQNGDHVLRKHDVTIHLRGDLWKFGRAVNLPLTNQDYGAKIDRAMQAAQAFGSAVIDSLRATAAQPETP
jgi:hypothetical protein